MENTDALLSIYTIINLLSQSGYIYIPGSADYRDN